MTSILSDNGLHFSSKDVEQFISYVYANHMFSSPYKHTTNGTIEQLNGTIMRGIKKMVDNNVKQWDALLASMLYAYRTKVHKKLGIYRPMKLYLVKRP